MGSATITLWGLREFLKWFAQGPSAVRYLKSPSPGQEARQVSLAGVKCRYGMNRALLPLRLAEVLSLERRPLPRGIQKCIEAFLADWVLLAFSTQRDRDAHPAFCKMVLHNEELSWPKARRHLHQETSAAPGVHSYTEQDSVSEAAWRTQRWNYSHCSEGLEGSGDVTPAGAPRTPTSGVVRARFYSLTFCSHFDTQ